MNLLEFAQVYVDLVEVEKSIPETEALAKEEINLLRTKYHNLLMDKMREEKIDFVDRFEAMHIAYELVQKNKADNFA